MENTMNVSLDFSTVRTTDDLLQALSNHKIEEFACKIPYNKVNNITVTSTDSPDYDAGDGNPYWEIYTLSNDTGSILVRVSFTYSSWCEDRDYEIEVVEPYEHTITSYRRV
jgi:hypothetical protein